MQKKTVTPNQQTSQNLNGVQTASLVTSHYEGVVPPPEMLEQFNRVNPTYADKIMQMALEASNWTEGAPRCAPIAESIPSSRTLRGFRRMRISYGR